MTNWAFPQSESISEYIARVMASGPQLDDEIRQFFMDVLGSALRAAEAARREGEYALRTAEAEVRVYTLTEVAKMTRVPHDALLRDCVNGRFTHIHVGRSRGMTIPQMKILIEALTVAGERCRETGAGAEQVRLASLRNARRASSKPWKAQ